MAVTVPIWFRARRHQLIKCFLMNNGPVTTVRPCFSLLFIKNGPVTTVRLYLSGNKLSWHIHKNHKECLLITHMYDKLKLNKLKKWHNTSMQHVVWMVSGCAYIISLNLGLNGLRSAEVAEVKYHRCKPLPLLFLLLPGIKEKQVKRSKPHWLYKTACDWQTLMRSDSVKLKKMVMGENNSRWLIQG